MAIRYKWEKFNTRTAVTTKTETYTVTNSAQYYKFPTYTPTVYVYTASAYTTTNNGFVLTNPTSEALAAKYSGGKKNMTGPLYVAVSFGSANSSGVFPEIFYIPEGSYAQLAGWTGATSVSEDLKETWYFGNGTAGTYTLDHLRRITTTQKGTANYGNVYSDNSGTYPTDGVHSDGYWYVYIGVETFNYVGVSGAVRGASRYAGINGTIKAITSVRAAVGGVVKEV